MKKNIALILLFLPCLVLAQVNASWNASTSSDVAVYRIYWGSAPKSYSDFRTTTETELQLPNYLFNRETVYYFAVTAIDFSGNESNYSAEAILSPVTDVTEESESSEEYTKIVLYNIRGRRVGDVKGMDWWGLASGIYFKVYWKDGVVVKTRKTRFVK